MYTFAVVDAQLPEQDPVHREPETDPWILTRYDDVTSEALNWQGLSHSAEHYDTGHAAGPGQVEILKLLDEEGLRVVDAQVTADPPRRKFHREAVNLAFSVPWVKAWGTYWSINCWTEPRRLQRRITRVDPTRSCTKRRRASSGTSA